MEKISKILLVFMLFSFVSCKENKGNKLDSLGNERAERISEFVQSKHEIIQGKNIIIVFQKGFCGSCEEKSIKRAEEIINTDNPIFLYREDDLELPVLNKFIEENRSLCYAIPLSEFDFFGLDVGNDIVFYLDGSSRVLGWNYLVDTH